MGNTIPFGYTPYHKAFAQADVYGIGYDEARANRRRIRLGICGVGGVAQSKYLPAIARLRTLWEPVEVAAIAEPRAKHADKAAAIYGCRAYADWHTMLAEEELDGVVVTAPDAVHAEIATACLEAGLAALVEKPVTRSLAEAQRLCQTADCAGLPLMVVANKRYAPPYRLAYEQVAGGPVTNPALMVGKFNLGYDYVDLFESGTIHLFDLARYFMGTVKTVRAVGVNKYQRNRQGYPFDNAVCQLEFSSSAVGMLYSSASALSFKPWERVEIYGDHAWLAVEDQYQLILYSGEEEPAQVWQPAPPNTLLFDEEFGGYLGLVENFCQVIRGEETPRVTGWDGYFALELAVASHLSMARHGEVIALPLDAAAADDEYKPWLAAHRIRANP